VNMADNTVLNAGAGGDTLATDDIAGIKHQRVKIEHGADGAASDVSTASPLPVSLANTGANATAVKVDGSAVTQPVSAAALPLPTGAATEATLGTLNGKVTACNTGAVTVAASALPTGAASSALQTSGNASLTSLDGKVTACNTGAVTVAGSALPTGAATSALQTSGNASLTSIDGKVTACNTGAVTVAGSALPTGAATSALQTSGNASLTSIDGKVTACNTGAVVVASGTLTAVTGITNALPAGTNLLGSIIAQQSSSVVYDGATACTVKRSNVVVAADGATVLAAVADKKFRVLAIAFTAVSATVTNVYLEDADGADVFGTAAGYLPLGVNADGDMISGIVLPWNPGGWFQTPTANKNLLAKLSAAQPVLITLTYIEVA